MIQFPKNLRTLCVVLALCLHLEYTNSQTMDEIIASASTEVSQFDMIGDSSGSMLRMELDMMLTVDQYLTLYGKKNTFNLANSNSLERQKRKAEIRLSRRWTNKQIPYRIEPSTFSSQEVGEIMSAMEEWESKTCVTFRPARSNEAAFVNFENGFGCASYIGMNRGKQPISLAPGCRVKGVITHEIGHAVGFFHEQNRPDRDDYIIIKTENIFDRQVLHNFAKYEWSAVASYGVPYDYRSIMHYGSKAFSGNNQNTIVTIDPAFQDVIGNRKGLSFYDIKLANLMYNCSQPCRSPVPCPGEGFLGKDCVCYCPGDPIKRCDERQTTPPPTRRTTMRVTARPTVRTTRRPTSVSCTDMNSNCPAWAKAGYCHSSEYVKIYCRGSCGMCGGSQMPTSPCKDNRSSCQSWGRLGFCSGMYSEFMKMSCSKTCGVCNTQTVVGRYGMNANTRTTASSLIDESTDDSENSGFSVVPSRVAALLLVLLSYFV